MRDKKKRKEGSWAWFIFYIEWLRKSLLVVNIWADLRDVRVGLWRKLSAKELMLLNCGVGEDSWESLRLQGDSTSPFWRSVLGVLWKEWCWSWNSSTWPPHAKSWLIGKDSDAGRDWGQEDKGMTEDEMAGWHHRLDGRESEWTPGVGDGQGGLTCCSSWGRKESDTTEQLNWTELKGTMEKTHTGKGMQKGRWECSWYILGTEWTDRSLWPDRGEVG